MAASSHLSRVCPLVRFKVNETKNNSINRKQNQRIADLQKKVAKLALLKNLPKKVRRAKAKTMRISKDTPDRVDPVSTSVKAIVRPFDVTKGLASTLVSGRPSQKFMAKANTSVTVPSGCYMYFMQAPCIAADATYASVIVCVQSAAATPVTGTWKNATVGDKVIAGGTLATLATNTPYNGSAITSQFEFANVSCGLRFTYEGAELYKSGTFKYIHDTELSYNDNGGSGYLTSSPATLVSFVDSAPNSIRQSINKNNVVEINATMQGYGTPIQTPSFWMNSSGSPVGGASASTYFGTAPGVLGYFLNSSSSSVSFHIETIEHWSISSPTLQALHTDSVTHVALQDQVHNFLASSRQLHAQQPNSHHVAVMKDARKAIGSPLGHEVLNAALTAALA